MSARRCSKDAREVEQPEKFKKLHEHHGNECVQSVKDQSEFWKRLFAS
jgi:hypothetical protein